MGKKQKPGKYARKRKKVPVMLWLLPVLLLAAVAIWLILPALGEQEETGAPSETAAPAETTVPEESSASVEVATVPISTEETVPGMPEAYQTVLDRYVTAVKEKWDFIQCEENQICYMIIFNYDLSKLGYHLADLDNNGLPELIISDGNVIYDLYTLDSGEARWVLSGGERNTYQLCEGGFLYNRGSNGASSHVENFYYLKDGNLILKENIFFDAMSESSVWTWTGEGSETAEAISEEEASEIIAAYEKVQIPMIPITDAI